MKTFGQVIREARKSIGLTQKAVLERLRRGDGRKVLPPFLNDLGFDHRLPPENSVIEQLAKILKLSPDILYFYAKRVPGDIAHNVDEERIVAAYHAWRVAPRRSGEPTRLIRVSFASTRTLPSARWRATWGVIPRLRQSGKRRKTRTAPPVPLRNARLPRHCGCRHYLPSASIYGCALTITDCARSANSPKSRWWLPCAS